MQCQSHNDSLSEYLVIKQQSILIFVVYTTQKLLIFAFIYKIL